MTSPDPQDRDHVEDRARSELADALGALDESEAGPFAETAAAVAMELPPVAPAPHTKAELLARINALPAPATTVEAPAGHVVPRGRGLRAGMRRPIVAVGAVAAALILFFAGFVSHGFIGGVSPARTSSPDPVAAILAQPDAVRASQQIATGGTATLVWSKRQGRAAIILNHAGRAPAGKTYELWLIRAGSPIAAGTLDSPSAVSTRELAGEVKPGDQIAMTIEPAGGSRQPTTTPIVVIPTKT